MIRTAPRGTRSTADRREEGVEATGPRRRQPDTTRRALVEAARARFSTLGYHGTPIEEVVRAASVTRGALYHHFGSKEGLFEAVVRETVEEVIGQVRELAPPLVDDPFANTKAGMQAYLKLCIQPQYAQLVLLDGPAVLGVRAVVSMTEEAFGSYWESVLAEHIEAGRIVDLPVAPLARLLASGVEEAGIYASLAPDPEAALREMSIVLDRLFEGLRPR
jgi:AcrR family transcriptional regulator